MSKDDDGLKPSDLVINLPLAKSQVTPTNDLLRFFHLREHPFDDRLDSKYLLLAPPHYQALATLLYGVVANEGVLGLIGGPGMGKSALLLKLLEHAAQDLKRTVLFVRPDVASGRIDILYDGSGRQRIQCDLLEFECRLAESFSDAEQMDRRAVIGIDEAQDMEESLFHACCAYPLAYSRKDRRLQVVLAGIPRLADRLAKPRHSRLRQQIGLVGCLRPLTMDETSTYIQRRLQQAGSSGTDIFTLGARKCIAKESYGIPRNINNFCFAALIRAYESRLSTVESGLLNEVRGAIYLPGVGVNLWRYKGLGSRCLTPVSMRG
jgi:MSHA biogenesis protein MshM